MKTTLASVVHVFALDYHLCSLWVAADLGHYDCGDRSGVTLSIERGGKYLFFPSDANLSAVYGTRLSLPPNWSETREFAHAVIAPGIMPVNGSVGTNTFRQSCGHLHEALLQETAKQLDITLEGELHKCHGYSLAKGLRKGILTSTSTRAAKKLGRVFIDLSRLKCEESFGKTLRFFVMTLGARCGYIFCSTDRM